MNDTELTRVYWEQFQKNNPTNKRNRNKEIIKVDYASLENINHHAIINGYIKLSGNSIKQSVSKIDSIVSAFKNNNQIKMVKLNVTPIDIRSDASIVNVSGIEKNRNSKSDKTKGKFEIEIIMLGNKS